MNDPAQGEPGNERPPNVAAAAAVAILVCLGLMGLFVWQPWSPGPQPVRSAGIDAR